ncbi:MAG: biotin--protein ligase [Alphaproteobacteria bacterium]|nr:biotin--protein ligase [Alphaproteobacteria bacterium]
MKTLLTPFYPMFSVFTASNTCDQERSTVYVYEDEGVGKNSLNQILSTFQKLIKNYSVKTINSEKVKEGVWNKHAIVLIIPGGADLLYVKKLNGKGNEVIQTYVKEGGSFLGICAGSYYGSSYVEFDKNGPSEVLESRELGFFKGHAIGPILAPYDHNTQSGGRAVTLYTTLPNVKKTIVFYNGSGFFQNAEQYPNTRVIGTYDHGLPALIFIHYGKGKVLLSGVHFEYDPSLINTDNQHMQKIKESLREDNEVREVLFKDLMTLIGVK